VRSIFDRDPVTGLRGSLFYRAYEPGGRAYRSWRWGIESGWSRDLARLLGELFAGLRQHFRPPRVQTPEGSVDRRDTVRHVVGHLKQLDDL
jgi:hypothetical protein